MDEETVTRCIQILDLLMEDENAWPFLKPVDPVADHCPSYFDDNQESNGFWHNPSRSC